MKGGHTITIYCGEKALVDCSGISPDGHFGVDEVMIKPICDIEEIHLKMICIIHAIGYLFIFIYTLIMYKSLKIGAIQRLLKMEENSEIENIYF